MAAPVLCLIFPIESGGGGRPDQGLPQPPLGIWGGAPPPYVDIGGPGWQPRPSHPIAPGGGGGGGFPSHPIYQPPGIWGPTDPRPGWGLPGGPPPTVWPGPGRPDQGLPPGGVGIWPSPGHPDQGLPGPQPIPTPPIYLPPGTLPGHPENPIYIPPSIWPSPGVPTHPIVLPPPGSGDKPEVLSDWEVKTAWSATTGWVVAIVPSESHPGVPTPA
jgi:hypothetical protein